MKINSLKEKREIIIVNQKQEEGNRSDKFHKQSLTINHKDDSSVKTFGIADNSKLKPMNQHDNKRLNNNYKKKKSKDQSQIFNQIKNESFEIDPSKNSNKLDILDTLSQIHFNKEGKNIRNRKESFNKMVFNEIEEFSVKSSFYSFLDNLNINNDKNLNENEEIKIFSNLSNNNNTLDFEEEKTSNYEKIKKDSSDHENNNYLIFNNVFDNFFHKKDEEKADNSYMNSNILSANGNF